MPRGAPYDSNRLFVYVQITDNENGERRFNISGSIVVTPSANSSYANTLNELLSVDTEYSPLVSLFNGNTVTSVQSITVLSNILNQQSMADQKALIRKNSSQIFNQLLHYLT